MLTQEILLISSLLKKYINLMNSNGNLNLSPTMMLNNKISDLKLLMLNFGMVMNILEMVLVLSSHHLLIEFM
jgi:hypothetical protein